jgi:molybdenum cofactor cytidylyltransferase
LTAPRRVVALVLAAGRSTRFGGDKLLEAVEGVPLGGHIAATLTGLRLDQYLAVCPADDAVRRNLYLGAGFEIVENANPQLGMGVSLAHGARRAIALDADALLVCLADMPDVTGDHLRALLGVDAPVVATEAAGVRSPPVVFARELLPQLTALTGDHGPRHLLRSAATVKADAGMVRDFDTPADFGQAKR